MQYVSPSFKSIISQLFIKKLEKERTSDSKRNNVYLIIQIEQVRVVFTLISLKVGDDFADVSNKIQNDGLGFIF